MTENPSIEIRSPWPDELARTWRFLGETNLTGHVYPLIAVTGDPERIVAAGAVAISPKRQARLHLKVRGRFCGKDLVLPLLEKAASIAAAKGAQSLGLVVPEAAPWHPFVEEAGFVRQRTDEWWRIIWNDLVEERTRKAERLSRSPQLSQDITTGPLTPDDFPAARAIAQEHGLADLDAAAGEGEGLEQYTASLSTVVQWKGEVAGIFLVKSQGDQIFVHVRAVAKAHLKKATAINAHFFARLMKPDYHKVAQYVFTAQPDKEKETIAMAKRFGGTLIGRFCRYQKPLS